MSTTTVVLSSQDSAGVAGCPGCGDGKRDIEGLVEEAKAAFRQAKGDRNVKRDI